MPVAKRLRRTTRRTDAPVAARPRATLRSVLQLVWRERHISRAEISRRLLLSRSTVSELIEQLLATGLVAEVGVGESKGGRRPIVLQFEDDAWGIVGVDIGAAHVSVAVTNLRGRVLEWEHQRHPVRDDPAGTLALVRSMTDASVRRWGKGRARLLGAGMSVPSPVDPRHPDRLSDLVLPAWRGIDVRRPLREEWGLPVQVDNDANLGALAERWWGAGREVDDFVYIKYATGLGAGHIIGGRIYRGATGTAGEIGHIAMDPHGPPCICGLRGCLVTLIGAHALAAKVRGLLPTHPDSLLARGEVDLAAIEDAALAGDALALGVVREAAGHLGVAVAGMLNVLNPALVVIGGGFVRLGDLLLDPLRETIRHRTLVTSLAASQIVTSALGAQATAMGAATLVLQRALSDVRNFPVAVARRS